MVWVTSISPLVAGLKGLGAKIFWAQTRTNSNSKNTQEFAVPFYEQFCESVTRHSEQIKDLVKTNIYIKYQFMTCDILEEFLNEFQQYYFTIGELDDPNLVHLIHRKLLEPCNIAIAESIYQKGF